MVGDHAVLPNSNRRITRRTTKPRIINNQVAGSRTVIVGGGVPAEGPPGLPGGVPGLPGGVPGLPGGVPGLPGGPPGLPGEVPGLPGPPGVVPPGGAPGPAELTAAGPGRPAMPGKASGVTSAGISEPFTGPVSADPPGAAMGAATASGAMSMTTGAPGAGARSGARSRWRTPASTRSWGPAADLVKCRAPGPRWPGERLARRASGSCSAAITGPLSAATIPPLPAPGVADRPYSPAATKNRLSKASASRSSCRRLPRCAAGTEANNSGWLLEPENNFVPLNAYA
jgi:hypothetical protein